MVLKQKNVYFFGNLKPMLYQTQNTLDDQLNYNKNVRMSQKMAHAWNNLRLDRVNIRF